MNNDTERAHQPADTPPSIVRANANRHVVVSPAFVSLYSNDTQLQMTPWDVRLIFLEITDPPTADDPVVTVKVTGEVRMSPQHAKKVVSILEAQLRRYEETIGPIPDPG